jgi:hypothetical protein
MIWMYVRSFIGVAVVCIGVVTVIATTTTWFIPDKALENIRMVPRYMVLFKTGITCTILLDRTQKQQNWNLKFKCFSTLAGR